MLFKFNIYFVIIIVSCIVLYGNETTAISNAKTCVGSFGKCDGIINIRQGVLTSDTEDPYFQCNLKSPRDCRSLCINDTRCRLSRFDRKSNICFLYTKGTFKETNDGDLIYVWECCHASECCSKSQNRCDGHWTVYENWNIKREDYFSLATYNINSPSSCLNKCLNNIWCGASNFINNSICILIRKWNLNITRWYYTTKSSKIYVWRCCRPFVAQPSNSDVCHDEPSISNNNRQGYMQPINPLFVKLSSEYKHIISEYHTQNYKSCIQSCSHQIDCTDAFYNETLGLCSLVNTTVDSTLNSKWPNETIFQRWNWTPCPIQKDIPIVKKDNCVCVQNISAIKLYHYNCNPETSMNISTKPLYHQMPFYDKRSPDLYDNKSFKLVFDGIHTYLMNLETKYALSSCSYFECLYHDGSINQNSEALSIYSRQDWFAAKPVETPESFSYLPTYVIIFEVFVPCNYFDECIDSIWNLQRHYIDKVDWNDIPYNFLVGNDGSVFEGRGWHTIGAHTFGYNDKSIGIGICGGSKLKNKSVSIKALTATKQLILYGVKNSFINSNYTVAGYRDVRMMKKAENLNPTENLYRVIQNWDNYISEKMQPPLICKNSLPIRTVGIILGCLGIAFSIIILSLVTYIKYFRHSHHSCKLIQQFPEKGYSYIVHLYGKRDKFATHMMNLKIENKMPDNFPFKNMHIYFLHDLKQICCCYDIISQLICDKNFVNPEDIFDESIVSYFLSKCKVCTFAFIAAPKSRFNWTTVIFFHSNNMQRNKLIVNILEKVFISRKSGNYCHDLCHKLLSNNTYKLQKIPYSNSKNTTVMAYEDINNVETIRSSLIAAQKRLERTKIKNKEIRFDNF